MASDCGEENRKAVLCSSSPEDADERSKRHKHRSHRHRHRHHRHRSKKDKDEVPRKEIEIGDVNVEDTKLDESVAIGDVVVSNGFVFSGVDYDMEEGEIVEEDGVTASGHRQFEMSMKDVNSDIESGEIANPDDDSNLEVIKDEFGNLDKNLSNLGDNSNEKVNDEKDNERDSGFDVYKTGDSEGKSKTDGNSSLSGDGKRRRISGDELKPSSQKVDSSSEKRRRTGAHSSSHERHSRDGSSSILNLSNPLEHPRVSPQLSSVFHEVAGMKDSHSMKKYDIDVDCGRMSERNRNSRNSSRDDAEKESKRCTYEYLEYTERHSDREIRKQYRNGSRERDSGHDKDSRREVERDFERESDREKIRVRDRDRDSVGRDGDRDRDRGRGRDRDRIKDRESETERGRERTKIRERDYVDRDRIRDRTREREREREMNKNTDRVRDGGRSGSRDKDRNPEIERLKRHKKYNHDGDGGRNHDNDSRQRRSDQSHSREKSKVFDIEKLCSDLNSEDRGNESHTCDDDGHEDYQEETTMQLNNQEEDDLERIKEESRRRKHAILEKYKDKLSQKSKTDSGEEPVQNISKEVESEITIENVDNGSEGAEMYLPEPTFSVGKSPIHNRDSAFEGPAGTGGLGEGTPKSERSADMFCDDIFGESPAVIRKKDKGDNLAVEQSDLHDNWDDAEGYYGYRFGEILDGRFEIIAAHGKGVFSTVVRARDLKAMPDDPEEVAIKIIRNNETMYKAGMEELVILKKLVRADPENKRHCVRFLSTFKYRNHLCLVFESLNMNLREVLKKFGRNIGLKLTAVRAYAKQLFIALKHLKNCGVLHCDIKPDNMLVNEAKNVLKLCDFGNAMLTGKNEITPYLVSRFYRAPEIILGLPYDHPMDIWSVGCCLFELYAGKVLFPGPTNNDMLRLHMELKGPFPKKMLRKGGFIDQHFDQDLNFLSIEEDPVTKRAVRRLLVNVKPKDFGSLLIGSPGEDPKMLANFKDIMEKIFVLDPEKRLTVSQALSHPFITGK